MINTILEAVYDKYLRKDDPELLKKKDEILKKIMEMPELEELAVDDALLDLCSTYEDRAFRSGFMAAVQCLNSLIGNAVKNHTSKESESEFEIMDSPMA